ncbi:MAG TPA: DMT family transporter [Bacilli bacterium]|nr:DMT family transporter [Bacilli bacterium]
MSTLLGIFFTILWSSAAIAIKLGLQSTTPLALATSRFLIAGGLLFLYVYVVKRSYRWPSRTEWRQLFALGLLNTSIYLGASFWALTSVSAGIFNLFVTTNPFIVAFLSYLWLKRKITAREWCGMLIAALGLLIATWPSIAVSETSVIGIVVLAIGMVSMAVGSVYFNKRALQLPGVVVNTWQVMIGGIVLIPFTFLLEHQTFFVEWDRNLLLSMAWLVLVISIGTMILWFYLLKQDAVRANNWLFLTPVFGYILASLFLGEPFTKYDLIATVCVMIGLFISGNITFGKRTKQA